MAKTRITNKECYILEGLRDQHRKLREKLETIEEIARDIVGEEEQYGHMDDFLWDEGQDLTDALDRLGIHVYQLTADEIDSASVHFLDTDNAKVDRLEDEED